jgi:hypothetical protein
MASRAPLPSPRLRTRTISLVLGLLLGCLLGLVPAVAAAQSVRADVLFDQGRELMQRGQYAAAAEKLEASHRIDPSSGTLLNLAECYRELGRTATAWSAYRAAASLAASERHPEREQFAMERVEALAPLLARVRVVVPEHARVEGLEVTLAYEGLPEPLWGTPVPVDPGTVWLRAEAPGKEPHVRRLEVRPRQQLDVFVRELVATRPAAVPAGRAEPARAPQAEQARAPQAEPAPPAEPGAEATGREQRALGWAITGVGALSMGVGAFLYTRAQSTIQDANCPDARCVVGESNPSLYEDGRHQERIGVGVGLAGAALAATGVVLVLTSPRSERHAALGLAVQPTPGTPSLWLTGAF